MTEPLHLTPLQQAAAVAGSIALLAAVAALIYGGRLREDYGALWFTAAAVTVVFAIWQDGLRLVARALDAVTLTAPLFLLSILFLAAVAIHFSVKLTRLSTDLKELARDLAILRGDRPPPGSERGETAVRDP